MTLLVLIAVVLFLASRSRFLPALIMTYRDKRDGLHHVWGAWIITGEVYCVNGIFDERGQLVAAAITPKFHSRSNLIRTLAVFSAQEAANSYLSVLEQLMTEQDRLYRGIPVQMSKGVTYWLPKLP